MYLLWNQWNIINDKEEMIKKNLLGKEWVGGVIEVIDKQKNVNNDKLKLQPQNLWHIHNK